MYLMDSSDSPLESEKDKPSGLQKVWGVKQLKY